MGQITTDDGYNRKFMCATEHCPKVEPMTLEQLQREYDYYMAEKMIKKMVKKRLIFAGECTRLLAEIRHYFSPILAKIMPKLLDIA